MEWKLYYEKGGFSSEDGTWQDAPYRGVQALAVPHPTANRQIQTGDFYLWPAWTSTPISADLYGVVDWLIETGVLKVDQTVYSLPPLRMFQCGIKWGRSLDSIEYNHLYRQVILDADLIEWGPKTTKAPDER